MHTLFFCLPKKEKDNNLGFVTASENTGRRDNVISSQLDSTQASPFCFFPSAAGTQNVSKGSYLLSVVIPRGLSASWLLLRVEFGVLSFDRCW